ncbi:hypothetical protein SKAU_G00308580 [Synaphobranchus kaupii]|uniref:DDE-1 domain-containing protein n=1 Tax=Synaphobranchus kaupii TaxID=118154 RepID=A0A9Q1ERF0_SYNKA|nr:hypothetical protein SKAU_G00308580 [Synaphobranchus kaupii]
MALLQLSAVNWHLNTQRNNISVPANWTEKQCAGEDWFGSFLARRHLSVRTPEATSLGRATAFNKTTVEEFFENLAAVMDRVRFKDDFMVGAPPGAKGASTRTGWMNEDTWPEFLDHLIEHTQCTPDRPMLLILDNLKAHISLKAVEKAKSNGIVLLTLPPHTSHRMQPLDVTVYGPFKTLYSRALDGWMRCNPGKTVSIYQIAGLVNEAFLSAVTPRNITAGFKSTEIFSLRKRLHHPWCQTGQTLSCSLHPLFHPLQMIQMVHSLQMIHLLQMNHLLQMIHSLMLIHPLRVVQMDVPHQLTQMCHVFPANLDMCLLVKSYHFPNVPPELKPKENV